MGVVYKAQDPIIGRAVAIKTLKSIFMGEDDAGKEALQRFRQESRSAGKLHHPNIITIFEAGKTENGTPYIVMEYIEGKSLEAQLAEQEVIEPLAVLHFLSQVASAIDYAHSQNVIHRDIKPSNIIIDPNYKPFLLDFGIAKLSDTSITPAGTVVGTPSYMSPEQIKGTELDGRTDIFSLAVIAFECFTGHRPFPGTEFAVVVSNIVNKEPLSFAEINRNLPIELERVLRRGLAKEKENRYQSALEFIDAAAQVFGVLLDGNGLAGGYTPGLKLEDYQQQDIAQRVRAQTVVGSFNPESMGLKKVPIDLKQIVSDFEAKPKESNNLNENIKLSSFSEKVSFEQPIEEEGLAQYNSKKKNIFGVTIFFIVVGLVFAAVIYKSTEFSKNIFSSVKGTLNGESQPEVVPIEDSPVVAKTEQENIDNSKTTAAEHTATVEPTPLALQAVKPKEIATEANVNSLSDAELLWLCSSSNDAVDEVSIMQSARIALAETVKRNNQHTLQILSELAQNNNYKVRIDFLKNLLTLPAELKAKITPKAVGLLSDSEFLVRGFAVKVLSTMKTKEVYQALNDRLLLEKNQVVLKVLNDSLSQIGNTDTAKQDSNK
ncbi:MAG: serine/threonine protein kinase [Proteobacteria bacterium]|nr:serine/threonine protein kinase [Pseudomonadota bacterium]